ncbi:MAG TPA: hypothetical protein VFY93_17035 [Planctomycetota bacterium]|nr:hypothetical protein [Planctomycetota bacterium]
MRNLVITILAAAALSAVTGCAATASDSGARSYEPNTMNAVVGVSMNRPETGVLLGANYEYRRDDKLGFGGFADIAIGDDTSTALGGAVFWHPKDRLTVFGGPGVNFTSGDADIIARVGGYYTFEWKKYTIAPTAWVDLGDDVAVFIGAGLIFHF